MARSHNIGAPQDVHMPNPALQARMMVLEAVNEYLDQDDHKELDDIYVVWYSYILCGWKAMVSTTIRDDRYYEVTHVHEGESYVDVYHKERQKTVPVDDPVHNL